MKLHLPTRLRAAVLACITAVAALATTVGTGALTTGVVAYTIAASQVEAAALVNRSFEYEGVTFSGGEMVVLDVANAANAEKGGTSHAISGAGNITVTLSTGDMTMTQTTGVDTSVLNSTGKGDSSKTYAVYLDFASTGAYYGQTMHLKGAEAAWNLTFDFGPITFGGLVTSAAEGGSYTVGGSTRALEFRATSDEVGANIINDAETTLVCNSVRVFNSGTWALSKDLTLGAATTVDAGKTIRVTGAGALHINGALTLNGTITNAATLVLGDVTLSESALLSNSGALTLNGTVSLYTPIMNGGTVSLGENIKFDLTNMTAEEGVYTLFTFNAVDLSGLTAENLLGTQAGYSYSFGSDGTVTATLTCQNLTWTGGPLTWEVGATIGEGTFADGDIVNFTTAEADVTLGGDVTSSQVNVASGVEVVLNGAHTLTAEEMNINGTLVMDDAVLSSSALKLAGELKLTATENIAEGTVIRNEGNAAKVTIVGESVRLQNVLNTADNSYKYSGKIVVADGATLKMGGQTALGNISNTITVEQGGVLDINGNPDHEYTFTLAGGSLVNNGNGVGTGSMQIKGLNVTADSVIGGTGQFGVIGRGYAATTVNLNAHTLTKTGTNTVNMVNTTVTAGTLRVEGGILQQHNSSRINCDIIVAGGNFTGDGCSMEGNHTLASEGAGGTIGCTITSTGAITVDTAADSTLTMSGALTTTAFTKTGEGTLAMTGALSVSKQLSMNYEGALTLGDVSVADGAVLTYGAASTDSVIGLAASSLAGNVTVDIFSLTAEQLAAGINLGIAADVETSKLTIGGLSEGDYTIETKGDTLWLKATKAAESDWDRNWGGAALSAAPATLEQLTITEENNFLATKYADSSVIGVQLTASEAANNVFGGILNTDVTQAATTAKRVWIDVTGGTYGIIAGGNNCVSWQGSSIQNFEGDTHIQLKGGSVGNIIGGNFKDGFGSSFKGSSYISVMEGSEVTGNIIGGNTSAHSQTTTFTGDSHIFVYTMLSTNSSDLESLGNAWIIGGSSWIANRAGGTQNFIGNTNVTIDLSDYTGEAATFVKTVVGGNFTAADSSTVQSLSGDTHVTVKGTDDTTFSGWMIAGARSSTVGTNTQTGNAEMVIDGGHYTGNVVGGFYQNGNSTTTLSGTAALSIKGGSFSNDVRGGSHVSGGTATLGGVALTIENGTFAKDVIAGMYNNVANTHQVTVGDTAVTMSNGTITGNLVGGSRLLTGEGLMTNGNISVAISGGSVAANIIGGDHISGAGGASLNAGIGDIAVTVSGGSVKDIYGGSHAERNYAAGTIAQGNVSVSLTGGSVTGDVYVGGYQGGSTKLTSESTTLEIGSGVTLTEGKTLSGGYKPYNDSFNLTATVTGSRTLKLTTDGAQDLSGMTVKDFDTVNVADAAGVVTIASITQSKGTNAITKTGAGTLTLGAGFTADSVTVSEGTLDITSVTALGGTLTMGNGTTLVTSTADTAMSATGLTLTSGMTLAVTGAAEGYTSPIKLLSGLTEATISGLTFEEVEGVKVASIEGIITVSGISSDYNSVTLEDGTLSLISSAAPTAELAWLGDSGTWNDSATEWTEEGSSDPVAYTAGANVTIGGEGAPGGTIEVSGAQKAKNMTFASGSSASDKYVVNAAAGASLAITGNLIVNEGVSAAMGFLPSLGESSQIVVNEGATLDMSAINNPGAAVLGVILNKGTGAGTIVINEGGMIMSPAEGYTLNTNLQVNGGMWLNGPANASRILEVTENAGFTLTGTLSLNSSAQVNVTGGSLSAGVISLGHSGAAGYKGVLNMTSGEVTTGSFTFTRTDTANIIDISGGTLTITGKEDKTAFTVGANDQSVVTISDATLKNGEKDLLFNHGSTLTDAKVSATADTTITVGGEGMTTTLVGELTTEGKVTLAGTLATDDLTAVNNSGTLTIDAEEVTLAGLNNTGSVVVNGNVELTDATTTGGNLSAADVTLTGANTFGALTATGTVTSTDTLTVGDGSEMAAVSEDTKLTTTGDVTIGSDASLSALSNTGHTLTVDGALTMTAATTAGGTVSADSLTLTGANTFEAITTTGAVTIGNTLNVTGLISAGSVALENVSLTAPALTAGGATGNALALTADTAQIATVMGVNTTLTLANVTGLTSATINGGTTFKVGSRDYSLNVAEGVVTITAEISDQFIWDATAQGSVWGDASSWEGDVQPTETSNVVFNGTGMEDVTIAGNAVAGNIFVESNANFITESTGSVATGGIEISDGTLTVGEGVTITATGTTSVVGNGAIIIAGTLNTDALAATGKDVELSGTLSVDTEGAVNSIGAHNGTYGHLIVGTETSFMMLDLVEDTLTIAADSTVDDLTIKNTGNLDAKGTFTVNNMAEVAVGGVMTVAKDLTISDDLTNAGAITVGSAAAPATLATEDVTNTGTITVFNTMSSTGNVDNQTDATLDVKGNLTANTAGKTVTNAGNLQVGGTADVAALTTTDGSTTTVKGNTTIAGALNNGGSLTVGTQAAPATLATGDVVNDGTITVFNTMTSTGDVTNNAGKTLDVKGNLTANTAGKTVNNEGTMTIGGAADVATLTTGDNATSTITGNATVATALTNAGSTTIGGTLTATNAAVTNEATGEGEKLTVTGALTADTLTTAAGATTEAKGGATLGSELANHGTTTITGDLASADATAPITITNDATGAGEKLTITGNVTAKSLTTQTDATTELTGTGKTVKLTDSLTNKGTTTIKGALTSADATATDPGSLVIENTGVLSTGNLTADALSGNGETTVTGNATMNELNLGTTGALTASGTVKTDSVSSTGGSVTADTLDLRGLTAAATIADVKADKITLSGFNMLKVTDSIANENGTGAAKVMLSLDAATMGTLSVGDEMVVVATDGSVAGQGVTLGNLAAVNSALKAYGIKGAMMTTAAGELVMQVQDNSFVSQVATSENGIAGAEMVDEASAAGLATAGTALGDVYAALDACRTTGDTATGDRLAAAVSGSSIAAMGSALSGDVERQLRAIRNRTTTMGVNQSVINENMPYVNAWVNAEGDYRKVAADGTMAGYKMMSWGGTVGMDVDFTPSFTAGLAATAMYGDFDAESEDHATGNIDTYYVSAFARYAKHRWTHTFVATAGLAETSLDRTILGHTVSGDSDGVMFGGMYEVGYVFALDKDATTCLQPIFNVSFTHASLSGYDESGANIGLSTSDVELNKLTLGLGARLQSIVGENIYNRSSILEARAMVKFDAGDRQGETDVTFAGSGLPTHTTKSSETGAIGAEFGVGLTVPVGAEGGNLFVDASAEIRAEYTNVNATVGYRVNF